jgi:hypothetical protein
MHKIQGNYSGEQLGAVKIYAATLEALRKKERGGSKQVETQFTTKNGAFLSFTPWKANALVCRVF